MVCVDCIPQSLVMRVLITEEGREICLSDCDSFCIQNGISCHRRNVDVKKVERIAAITCCHVGAAGIPARLLDLVIKALLIVPAREREPRGDNAGFG